MVKKKVKAYMYTRVSTSMQVDGYSLDAQKEKIRKYADAFEYAIVGEYEDADKRNLLSALIDEIQVYEEEQAKGQWLKSIGFKLPIIDSKMDLGLGNDSHVETVCLLSNRKVKPDSYVDLSINMEG